MDALSYQDQKVWDKYDKLGYANAVATERHLSEAPKPNNHGPELLAIRKWIAHEDEKRQLSRDQEAVRSLKIAKWSAIFAAVSAAISLASTLITLFHKDEPQKVIVQVQVQPQPAIKPAAVKSHQNK